VVQGFRMRFCGWALLGGACVVVVAAGSPAPAQDWYEGPAYAVGCGEEGCFLNAAGYLLFAPLDGWSDSLGALPMPSAVEIAGTLSGMGDSSAEIVLERVSRIEDDLYEGNLQAMQGNWVPVGEETPFHIAIHGLDWAEIQLEEVLDTFMISVGETCANGVAPGGMAISLYRYGDDPDADACWQLEYVDDASMTLRRVGDEGGSVDFERLQG
jgi:hypothetical protein